MFDADIQHETCRNVLAHSVTTLHPAYTGVNIPEVVSFALIKANEISTECYDMVSHAVCYEFNPECSNGSLKPLCYPMYTCKIIVVLDIMKLITDFDRQSYVFIDSAILIL